jgi:NADH:ubiquinone oxidoreductase subunit 4 (subunit M)
MGKRSGAFFMIDIIESRYGTRWMNELSGVAGQMKKFAVIFMIILLGSVGLPLTNGFIGEFLLLMGIYQHNAGLRPLRDSHSYSERPICCDSTGMFSSVKQCRVL